MKTIEDEQILELYKEALEALLKDHSLLGNCGICWYLLNAMRNVYEYEDSIEFNLKLEPYIFVDDYLELNPKTLRQYGIMIPNRIDLAKELIAYIEVI